MAKLSTGAGGARTPRPDRKRRQRVRTVEEAADEAGLPADAAAEPTRPSRQRAAAGISLVLVLVVCVVIVMKAHGHQTQAPPPPPVVSLSQAERDDFVRRYAIPEQLSDERPTAQTEFWDFRTSPPTPPPPSLPPKPPPVIFSEIDCADVCERVHALLQCMSDCCDEACKRKKHPGLGCEPDHCAVLKRRDEYFALKGG